MNQRWPASWIAALALLALAGTRPGWAAAPPGPWVTEDIGTPAAAGSTDLAAGDVWTLKASGDDIWNFNDNFHYAYQSVAGDGSITAQVLSASGGDANWRKSGLMIRADNSDSSAEVLFAFTPVLGLFAQARLASGEQSVLFNQVGPSNHSEPNRLIRLQRVGSEIAGFYSMDGGIWAQASFSPPSLPALGPNALFGLALTSHLDGKLATARFGQVAIQPGVVSAYGVLTSAGDRSVQLQWHALPQAAGFNVYRGPANLSNGPLVRLNDHPIVSTSYTDASDGLVNGTRVTYAIAPLFSAADGTPVEGPKVAVQAIPVAAPAGWLGTSMNEGTQMGSVTVDSNTGTITLRGAGGSYFDANDQGYFLNQLATGDVQVTAKVLTRTGPAAGVMISEALDGSGRRAFLAVEPGFGLIFQVRTRKHGVARFKTPQSLNLTALKTPIVLRLTRRGAAIFPEYSTDDGKNFLPAAGPLNLDGDPASTVYAGIAAINGDHFQVQQARFAGLDLKKP